jgi:hypothetical protein
MTRATNATADVRTAAVWNDTTDERKSDGGIRTAYNAAFQYILAVQEAADSEMDFGRDRIIRRIQSLVET